jgi:hypothetical protein
MALVGTKEINGVECEIHADKHGSWSIKEPDTDEGRGKSLGHSSNSLEQAIQQARTELNKRKVKVAVTFYLSDGTQGTATSIHGRTGKIMATIGGDSKQLDTYTKALRGDTPSEKVARIKEINSEMAALRTEQASIYKEFGVGLVEAVRSAINDALDNDK